MISIYKLFDRAVKWNAFEAFVYQTLLTLHQILLFQVLNRSCFGLLGTIFSLLYLIILILNLGFDKSLAPFYRAFMQNKIQFRKIFLTQFILQISILSMTSFFFIFFYSNLSQLFSASFKCPVITFKTWIIISLLIILEGIKKSLKMIAQLSFLNKESALIELTSLIIYLIIIWSSYFYNSYTIDFSLIFSALLIQSLLSNLLFSFLILKIYKKLPIKNEIYEPLSNRIAKNRLFDFINEITRLLFSGNFLIPFLAFFFGLAQISILKLINIIAIYISVILERTFGLTSGALLSHVKDLSKEMKQRALNIATRKLYTILYGIMILSIISFNVIFKKYFPNEKLIFPSYIFFLIIIFENFFITYEEFFLVEEKIYYFCIINLTSVFLFYGLLTLFKTFLLNYLIYLLIIRIFTFLFIRTISKYKLKIRLPYKIDIKYILIYIILGLFCLFFTFI